jgi:hypothetical protein
VYGFVQPHTHTGDAITYTFGAAIVFVTMFTALLMQVEYTDGQSDHVVSVLLIALNAALALLAMIEGIRASKSGFVSEHVVPLFRSNNVLRTGEELPSSITDHSNFEQHDQLAPSSFEHVLTAPKL